MALQDTIKIKNDLTPKQTLEKFLKIGSINIAIETSVIPQYLTFYISDYENVFRIFSSNNLFKYVEETEMDINANVNIALDLYNLEWQSAKGMVVEIMCQAASQLNWEFILYHDDTPTMIYKNNQLVLNTLANFWKRESNLNLVSLPYVFLEIPY